MGLVEVTDLYLQTFDEQRYVSYPQRIYHLAYAQNYYLHSYQAALQEHNITYT
ncbi:hypothetical protein D3C76_1763100 [compost metagenome]